MSSPNNDSDDSHQSPKPIAKVRDFPSIESVQNEATSEMNLQSQFSGISISPIVSAGEEDELINNILPSYHMYQLTISKNLTPTDENFRVDPPIYEVSPVTTSNTLNSLSLFGFQTPMNESVNNSVEAFPLSITESLTFNEESAQVWENTILANAHKLPNLTKTNNAVSSNLEVKITVTEKVCQVGMKPTVIDPSNKEFRQGDYIHGYVTIVNKSDKPILFDMVYIVFEGVITVLDNNKGFLDSENPVNVFKFLNMTDLYASWTYANIDRLVTDNGDPHDWCEGETDPYDNTALSIDVKRLFQPGVTYKRFFTFRVPQKLLDDICEPHSLSRHTDVPPSIGIPRGLIAPSLLLANRESQIRDMAFIDTCISYSVDARVIGKSSDYNYETHDSRDRYIIAKEATCPIRVIPTTNLEYECNPKAMIQEAGLYYKAFVDSIVSKIEYGNDLTNASTNPRTLNLQALTPVGSRDSNHKLRQLYDVADMSIKHNLKKNRKQFADDIYQFTTSFKKKSLTGSVKVLGIVSLSTPKEHYSISYVPPIKFREPGKKYNTTILVPIELSYFVEGSNTSKVVFPEIKSLQSELVVFSVRSKKHCFPFEFTHEMCFKDENIDSSKKNEPDNFDLIIVKPFQGYINEIQNLIKNVSNEVLRFETQMYKDIRSVSALSTKYINLSIPDFELHSKSSKSSGNHALVKTIPWESERIEQEDHLLYSKKFDVTLDLNSCHLKGPDNKHNRGFDYLTLVPSFQTCLMARMYYIKIVIKMVSGDSLVVHVPLTVDNY